MQAERDVLVRRVFPALRERLEPHRIELFEIDLRWGITEEDAADGRTLSLCLREIDVCRSSLDEEGRPFFIGLLGQRPGTTLSALPDDAVKAFPWLRQQWNLGPRSMTALEVFHAALREPRRPGEAFFYLRDDAYLEEARVSAARISSEEARSSGITKLEDIYVGRTAAGKDDGHGTLEAEVIARSESNGGPLTVRRYRPGWAWSPEGVGRLTGLNRLAKLIESDLYGALTRGVPVSGATPVDLHDTSDEVEEHERFARNRTELWVERPELEEHLHRQVAVGGRIVWVSGRRGSGKSALLARLANESSARGTKVVSHYVGAGPRSGRLDVLLRHLVRQLDSEWVVAGRTASELAHDLRAAIVRATALDRVLIIIDAVDQIEDIEMAHELGWIPNGFAERCTVVLSSSTGGSGARQVVQNLHSRAAVEIPVPSLSEDERRTIVSVYPRVWAKRLDDRLVRLLVENDAAGSPLFLIVALAELRGFGSHDLLEHRIRSFPSGVAALPALFEQVIERLEREHVPGLAEVVLSSIAASRGGLTERELTMIVEASNKESSSDLFPLLRQLRPYLFHRGLARDFFHLQMSRAVEVRYLSSSDKITATHGRIADVFRRLADPTGDGSYSGPRRPLEELPYHLDRAQESKQLLRLGTPRFIRRRAELTADIAALREDFHLLFRAAVRTKDVRAAIILAGRQRRMAIWGRWLRSDAGAAMVARAGSGSPWVELMRSELMRAAPPQRRAAFISMMRLGVDQSLSVWLRSVFDIDSARASHDARSDFLAAVARAEPSSLEYVVARIPPGTANANLVTAVIGSIQENVMGRAWPEIIARGCEDSDAVVAAATAWAQCDAPRAIEGALALRDDSIDRSLGSSWHRVRAAIAEGLGAHGDHQAAEVLLRETIGRPLFVGEFESRTEAAAAWSQAAVHVLRAALHLPVSLWSEAHRFLREASARSDAHAVGSLLRQAERVGGCLATYLRHPDPHVRRPLVRAAVRRAVALVTCDDATERDPMLEMLDDLDLPAAQQLRRSLADALGPLSTDNPDAALLEPLRTELGIDDTSAEVPDVSVDGEALEALLEAARTYRRARTQSGDALERLRADFWGRKSEALHRALLSEVEREMWDEASGDSAMAATFYAALHSAMLADDRQWSLARWRLGDSKVEQLCLVHAGLLAKFATERDPTTVEQLVGTTRLLLAVTEIGQHGGALEQRFWRDRVERPASGVIDVVGALPFAPRDVVDVLIELIDEAFVRFEPERTLTASLLERLTRLRVGMLASHWVDETVAFVAGCVEPGVLPRGLLGFTVKHASAGSLDGLLLYALDSVGTTTARWVDEALRDGLGGVEDDTLLRLAAHVLVSSTPTQLEEYVVRLVVMGRKRPDYLRSFVRLVIERAEEVRQRDATQSGVLLAAASYGFARIGAVPTEIADQIRDHVPGLELGTASWAVHLLATPLAAVALPVATQLLSTPGVFVHPDGARSLRRLLVAWVQHTKRSDPFDALLAWVPRMPLVTNEDLREAYIVALLVGAAELGASERIRVQNRILDVFDDGTLTAGRILRASLAELAIDPEIASRGLASVLRTSKQVVGDRPRELWSIVVENRRAGPALSAELSAALDADRELAIEQLKLGSRSAVAGCWREIVDERLRRDVWALLEQAYRGEVRRVTRGELDGFVAADDTFWDQTVIELDNPDVAHLIQWVRTVMKSDPASVEVAVILVSSWLASTDQGSFTDVWLALSMDEDVPLELRRLLARAIEGRIRSRLHDRLAKS